MNEKNEVPNYKLAGLANKQTERLIETQKNNNNMYIYMNDPCQLPVTAI